MGILKCTAPAGLPLNPGVEVKKVRLIYFERQAGRFLLDIPRTPKFATFNDLIKPYVERAIGAE